MEDQLLLFFWYVGYNRKEAQRILFDVIEAGQWVPFSIAVSAVTFLSIDHGISPYVYLSLYRQSYNSLKISS